MMPAQLVCVCLASSFCSHNSTEAAAKVNDARALRKTQPLAMEVPQLIAAWADTYMKAITCRFNTMRHSLIQMSDLKLHIWHVASYWAFLCASCCINKTLIITPELVEMDGKEKVKSEIVKCLVSSAGLHKHLETSSVCVVIFLLHCHTDEHPLWIYCDPQRCYRGGQTQNGGRCFSALITGITFVNQRTLINQSDFPICLLACPQGENTTSVSCNLRFFVTECEAISPRPVVEPPPAPSIIGDSADEQQSVSAPAGKKNLSVDAELPQSLVYEGVAAAVKGPGRGIFSGTRSLCPLARAHKTTLALAPPHALQKKKPWPSFSCTNSHLSPG